MSNKGRYRLKRHRRRHSEGGVRKSYWRRNARVNALLHMTWQQYLDSPLWRSIRASALSRDNHACQLCGSVATEVHHRDYNADTILGKSPSSLMSVCRSCHKAIEFDGTRKVSIEEMQRRIAFVAKRKTKLRKSRPLNQKGGLQTAQAQKPFNGPAPEPAGRGKDPATTLIRQPRNEVQAHRASCSDHCPLAHTGTRYAAKLQRLRTAQAPTWEPPRRTALGLLSQRNA